MVYKIGAGAKLLVPMELNVNTKFFYMKIISQNELEKLANHRDEHCISIFIPTHRAGKEVLNGEDAIRFKNQLQTVKNKLEDKNLDQRKVNQLLDQAQKLMDDSSFWHHQLEGLAVFISENHFSYHRVPIQLDEYCSINNSFYMMPLLPLFSGDGLYYVLALSKEKVRLLEGTRYYINELETDDTLQQGIIEVLKNYDFDNQIQNQSSSQGGGYIGSGGALPGGTKGGGGVNPSGNRGGGNFHGQGDNSADQEKHLLFEYFRNLNEGLSNYIKSDKVPIVLASVEHYQPIFQDAAKPFNYRIMEKGVVGNPDLEHPEKLHKESWKIVEPFFNEEREKSRRSYKDLAGTGKTSYHLDEIVSAAFSGRIDSLFVAKGAHKWGSFKPDTQDVDIHEEFQEGDIDLISKSAVQTILNGGHTFVVDPNELPDKTVPTEIVALMRY